MRPITYSFRCGLLGLVSVASAGSIVVADPIEPSKIPTLRIGPSAGDQPELPTPLTGSSKVHIMIARPRPAGERRDGFGRVVPAEQGRERSMSDADRSSNQTIPVRPDPVSTSDPDRNAVHTLGVPSQIGPPTGHFEPPRNPD